MKGNRTLLWRSTSKNAVFWCMIDTNVIQMQKIKYWKKLDIWYSFECKEKVWDHFSIKSLKTTNSIHIFESNTAREHYSAYYRIQFSIQAKNTSTLLINCSRNSSKTSTKKISLLFSWKISIIQSSFPRYLNWLRTTT